VAHYYVVPLIATTIFTLMPMPVSATEVSCLYDSNSEWPWANSRVCQLQVKPLIFDDAGQPVCSDIRADKDGDGWGWENGNSCVIDPNQPAKQRSAPGLVVNQEDLVVFEQDFESADVGTYLPEVLNDQWHTPMWHMGVREERAKIGSGIERNFEELYISYDVKFADNFDFVRGGKLPGLCGYNVTQDPRDGCNTGGGFPTGYDGWSARGMWREDGKLENYVYHADQFYEYGDDEYWTAKAERGTWHSFQHRIVLNTVGEANGIVEAWFDGVKVLSSNTMLYRKTEDIGINLFYFSTFYGGADPSWAPTSDQYMYFDNFRIATTPLPEAVTGDSVTRQSAEIAAAISAEGVGSGSLSVIDESQSGVDVLSKPPELAAANEAESGGGVFYPWIVGLLILLRRKF